MEEDDSQITEIFPLLASPSSSSLDKVHTSITLFSLVRRFRYFSVSSVIDKDNSQSDWRKDFYNGRNGNYRKINGKGYVFRPLFPTGLDGDYPVVRFRLYPVFIEHIDAGATNARGVVVEV